ncbi:MAG: hypothetical protein AAF481_04665 [Acidobacteriota bacterium]
MRSASDPSKLQIRGPATAVVVMMLCLAFAGGADAASEAEGCPNQAAALYLDGTGSAPVEVEALREELGEFVNHCNYTLATKDLEEAVGDCAVTAVTIEGSEPLPRLLTMNKGWDEVLGQEEVSPSDGEMAWTWTGDALNCDEAG